MERRQIAWDSCPDSITTLGTWRVGVLFEPAGGETPGGDRFSLRLAPGGEVAFYLADATGHGRRGAGFWSDFGTPFAEIWQPFAAAPSETLLVRTAKELNDVLHAGLLDESGEHNPSQLCMAMGWISNEGTVVVATLGLGVHADAVTAAGPARVPVAESFGLRLGWLPSSEWPRIERSLVIRRIPGIHRLWLASDAFFGDDHWDPDGALGKVAELSNKLEGLAVGDALHHVSSLPHSEDDATFVILERPNT